MLLASCEGVSLKCTSSALRWPLSVKGFISHGSSGKAVALLNVLDHLHHLFVSPGEKLSLKTFLKQWQVPKNVCIVFFSREPSEHVPKTILVVHKCLHATKSLPTSLALRLVTKSSKVSLLMQKFSNHCSQLNVFLPQCPKMLIFLLVSTFCDHILHYCNSK